MKYYSSSWSKKLNWKENVIWTCNKNGKRETSRKSNALSHPRNLKQRKKVKDLARVGKFPPAQV